VPQGKSSKKVSAGTTGGKYVQAWRQGERGGGEREGGERLRGGTFKQ